MRPLLVISSARYKLITRSVSFDYRLLISHDNRPFFPSFLQRRTRRMLMLHQRLLLGAAAQRKAGYCAHSKRRAVCRACSPQAYCPHNRLRRQCRECKGAAYCAHGVRRVACSICGSGHAIVCPHGVRATGCELCAPAVRLTSPLLKEQNFSSHTCIHGSRRYDCFACGGKGTCPHGKHRLACRLGCGALCRHGREQYSCRSCGGKGFCFHGKHKKSCRYCSNRFCLHGVRKYGKPRRRCPPCGGQEICPHGQHSWHCEVCRSIRSPLCPHGRKDPRDCATCDGKGICAHGRIIRYCRSCGSDRFCPHRRKRRSCAVCRYSVCPHDAPYDRCGECSRSARVEA